MVNLIKDLVSYKTVYPNKKEFEGCFEYIRKYFGGTDLIIEQYQFNNEISMMIANTNDKNLDVIMCGHIDVVPASDDLFEIKVDGDNAFGRGVSDMKGQDAIMMDIIKNLKTDKKVGLLLTSDEERGGFNGTSKILDLYNCKVAIVPDGGFNYETVVEEKGLFQFIITVNGKEAHASMPHEGENAIVKAFDIYNKLIDNYPLPQNTNDWVTSINLSKIEGGDAFNKVPSKAKLYFDVRYVKSVCPKDITDFLKNIDNTLEIEVNEECGTFEVDKGNKYIKKFADSYQKILGDNIKIIKYPAASDARFFSDKEIPCIMINPIGGNIHSMNEWVSIESLNKLQELFEDYINSI